MNDLDLEIAAPADFSFAATVFSHGWRRLAPFEYDDEAGVLYRAERLPIAGPAVMRMSPGGPGSVRVQVTTARSLEDADAGVVSRAVVRCLGLDRDLTGFYEAIAGEPRRKWMIDHRAGRMLASPTLWEDLVKTLATTNISWSGTMAACGRLTLLGPEIDGRRCFPTPSEISAMEVEELAEATRLGYRVPCLRALASAIHSGDLDPECWKDPALDTDEIARQILALKGFGPYAAANVLKLLGRHERLAIDSSVRERFRILINDGVKPSDSDIERCYEPFGRWRGLVMWLDVMKPHLLPNLEKAGQTT